MFDIFHRSAPDIVTVKTKQKFSGGWARDAIVFYVKNGKGILSVRYGCLKDARLERLVYGDVLLIKFHGDEYFFPTCEKLVSAGYGLDMGDETVISSLCERFNQKFVSLEHSLENLRPLLVLLPTGYYVLADTELYPTDGSFSGVVVEELQSGPHGQYTARIGKIIAAHLSKDDLPTLQAFAKNLIKKIKEEYMNRFPDDIPQAALVGCFPNVTPTSSKGRLLKATPN